MQGKDMAAARREISAGVVAIHRKHFGRGSDGVRTITQDDYVATFLSDIFTPAERTLIAAGHYEQVQTARHLFQAALRDEFVGIVEDALGRRVRAFFSQVHSNPDMAMEAFVLEPAGD